MNLHNSPQTHSYVIKQHILSSLTNFTAEFPITGGKQTASLFRSFKSCPELWIIKATLNNKIRLKKYVCLSVYLTICNCIKADLPSAATGALFSSLSVIRDSEAS